MRNKYVHATKHYKPTYSNSHTPGSKMFFEIKREFCRVVDEHMNCRFSLTHTNVPRQIDIGVIFHDPSPEEVK